MKFVSWFAVRISISESLKLILSDIIRVLPLLEGACLWLTLSNGTTAEGLTQSRFTHLSSVATGSGNTLGVKVLLNLGLNLLISLRRLSNIVKLLSSSLNFINAFKEKGSLFIGIDLVSSELSVLYQLSEPLVVLRFCFFECLSLYINGLVLKGSKIPCQLRFIREEFPSLNDILSIYTFRTIKVFTAWCNSFRAHVVLTHREFLTVVEHQWLGRWWLHGTVVVVLYLYYSDLVK